MKRGLGLFILLLALLPTKALAQANVALWCKVASSSPPSWAPCDAVNPLAVNASVSASITGWPGVSQSTGTPISVTTGGVTGTLPAGAVVLATNDGATNTAYCKLGASATTSDTPIYPHSSVSFTTGGATQLTCITSTSTTTVNMSGGAGLPTGWGGGAGGGGGGGAVTVANGADTAEGSIGDVAWVSGNGTVIAILKNIAGGVAGSIPAGTNVIGHVIVDTGSTTAVTQATASNLNATVIGAGSAGTANSGVVTVQGIASMTPILANPGTAANWGVVATGAAPPSNAQYLGANASGATGGQVRGLINCDNHVFKHITTATDTLAVQGVASQTIYICGWRSRAAGVATWFLENTASANANCSSSNTQITGVATEAANTGEVNNNPIWGGLKNTSGNGLCINSTGTGGVDIDIWYTQF